MKPAVTRVLAALVATLVALLVAVAPAAAQQGPDVEVTGIDLSDFPTVRLRFAVAAGVTDTDLDPSSVEVSENGEPVDETLTPLSDQAIAVLLTVDTSGSMQGEAIEQAKVAALELLETLPDDAAVGVVGFGTQAQLVSPFTTDRGETTEAIEGLTATGGTALYDAVELSAQQIRASEADRAALVVLSDGADSDSSTSLDEAAAAVADTRTDFFAVALQTGETDPAALDTLAESAAGRVVPAEDADALAAAYVDIGQRIVNQYQVEFVSSTPDAIAEYTIGVAGTDASTSVSVAIPGRVDAGSDEPDDEVVAPRPLPEPLVTSTEPELLEQGWVVWVGAALVGIAIALTIVLVVPSGDGRRIKVERRRSLNSDAPTVSADANPAERAFASVRAAVTRVTTRAVERTESEGRIDTALDRAGLVMRAGEFVALVITVALGAGALAYLLFGPVLGIISFLVPLLGANAFLSFKASRRNAKFADQLGDTLLVLSGALRSGFGVGQAIDTVAEEMDPPMSTEFRRAILETRLGRDIEEALDGVARRVQNEDFEWVVDAMRINRQVGGDLAQILDQVAETIRARNRLKRQVAALTAEGRISALVLGLLPIVIGLVLFTSNPDYLEPLWSRTAGQIALAFAVALLAAGAFWLKKLIDIEY